MKLYIAGHNGMVGSALVRRFEREPGVTLVLRTRKELDLTSQSAVEAFYAAEKPDVAIIAAAKVGGTTRWVASASVALAEHPFSLTLARLLSLTLPRPASLNLL